MENYLRFEILEHFAYNEKLSVAMVEKTFKQHKHTTRTNRSVEHHRPEISEAFEFLKEARLIIELKDKFPGPGRVLGRGRPHKYYRITEDGLRIFIADPRISKTQFWKGLYGYCLNSDIGLTIDKLEELLRIYI